MKILITSVGSLVGQNLLDVLESDLCRRRTLVTVIGTNSIAANPQNFRCDVAYLVSDTITAAFGRELAEIIELERPDLILNGRDEDTEVVMRLMALNPSLPGRLPYGSLETVSAAVDKGKTSAFCRRHGLAFADSFVPAGPAPDEALETFVQRHGYPLIAKPVRGFASKGVVFIRRWEDVERVCARSGYMIQEYLGDPQLLSGYFESLDSLTPLFAHAPDIYHHTCHTVIAPDGTFARFFMSRNDHQNGMTMGLVRVDDPVLESLAEAFARAIVAEGGYGPLSIQFRQTRNGEWKAQEVNMRTNGNTFPRFLMGQDDIGLIAQGVCPEFQLPIYTPGPAASGVVIGKSIASKSMPGDHLAELTSRRRWCA